MNTKPTSIFISYNPGNEFEQTLAVRLHTIGAVHNFNMQMPDRFTSSKIISQETIFRIKSSEYFILFSTSVLTPIVQQEVNIAFEHLQDKSKILIIYNKVKNLQHNAANCTEVYIDAGKESAQEILERIIKEIKINAVKSSHKKVAVKDENNAMNVLGGILLVGLGLLALGTILNPQKNK